MVYKPELDFKLARRRGALSQADCAHMLGTDQPRISKFERGKAQPSTVESVLLAALFGEALDRRSMTVIAEQQDELLERLRTIPDCPSSWRDPQRRFRTLASFAEFLSDLNPERYV